MRPGLAARRASTLVEVVLGMAVSAILLGALSSAMIVSSKAVPDSSSPLKATTDAAMAIDQLADELLVATTAATRTPNAIEFTVADRNNDAVAETIRYEWSGVYGAALRRKYNDGAWVNILDDVRNLEFSYDTYVDTSSPSTPTESGETLLAGYTAAGSPADWPVNDKEWIGQYFVPTLPAETTSWKITRVRLAARVHGASAGISRVQLQRAGETKTPGGAILDESMLTESELSNSYLWKNISFHKAGGLTPGTGVCLVVQWLKDTDACAVRLEQSRTSSADAALLTTTNTGASWAASSTKSMLFEIYGTYSAPSVSPPAPPTYLTGVRIRLQAGNSTATEMETRVPVLNEPRI